jgi:hypothetical protein
VRRWGVLRLQHTRNKGRLGQRAILSYGCYTAVPCCSTQSFVRERPLTATSFAGCEIA